MTGLDYYREVRNRNTELANKIDLVLGIMDDEMKEKYSPDKSKFEFTDKPYSDIQLFACMEYGHNDFSNVFRCGKEMQPYLIEALNFYAHSIADRMKTVLQREIEQARQAAEDEIWAAVDSFVDAPSEESKESD